MDIYILQMAGQIETWDFAELPPAMGKKAPQHLALAVWSRLLTAKLSFLEQETGQK